MSFPADAYGLALMSSFLISAASLPFWRRFCTRYGLVDRPGTRKIHGTPVPTAGGLAVATGVAVPLVASFFMVETRALGPEAAELLSYGIQKRGRQILAIFAGALGMLILGLIDDRYPLKAGPKFGVQWLLATGVAVSGVRITLFVDNLLFSYGMTVLWILTTVNAFNFTDNMNGLSAGLGAIAAGFFAIHGALPGHYLVAAFSFLVSGALLGFLPYNYPAAKSFLGDAGSHLVGFLIGVLGILPHFYSAGKPSHLFVLTPLIVLAVPLGDLLWVVIIRLRLKRPIYLGDNNHISHCLVRAGLHPTRAVALIWGAGVIAGLLSLSVHL